MMLDRFTVGEHYRMTADSIVELKCAPHLNLQITNLQSGITTVRVSCPEDSISESVSSLRHALDILATHPDPVGYHFIRNKYEKLLCTVGISQYFKAEDAPKAYAGRTGGQYYGFGAK